MNPHHSYREQIDACRPGSDDLSLPELAELAAAAESDRGVSEELARSQRFDLAVAAAMHDVPLPSGLAQRLLASLAAGNPSPAVDVVGGEGRAAERTILEPSVVSAVAAAAESDAALIATDSEAERVSPAAGPDSPPARMSRRFVLAGVGAISLAALLAVGFWQFGGSAPRHISEAELTDAGMQWFRDAAAGDWRTATAPLPGFPIDRQAVVVPRNLAWKSLPVKSGERAVAYNLTSSGKGRVLLFIVQTKNVYAVPTLPYKPLSGATDGVALAAWQSDGLLYVLAVDTSEQRLEDVVRKPQITAAPTVIGLPPA